MTLEELRKIGATHQESERQFQHRIHVCRETPCLSSHSDKVMEALEGEVKARGLEKICKVRGVGCMGLCAKGPLVKIEPDGHLYQNVQPEDAPAIVASQGSAPVERLQLDANAPFFTKQKKIVLQDLDRIDPERLEDYIAVGGYAALGKALTEMDSPEVIDQITKSGLRGRGGAGFPTGLKWGTVAKAGGSNAFVICNGDEGDPGAFMDRSVLEGNPHRILEGMAIAAYAVGATQGYVYVRAEYPLAVKRLKTAIHQGERHGLLGNNICGTRHNFSVEIRLGAGAFVCGEETALIASIEGGRGTPRPRPPFPAVSGLWGQPTLLNNVETFANVAPIIRNGADWFAAIGTEKSKGTKVFSLAGNVNNTGLIEVPMGLTLREIIMEIGGGIPGGKKFKAVQTGGPSGGCIPEQYLDMPVDYESLAKVGSIMGSGGMIVMDEDTSMVDIARFYMEFCMEESCGKCIPCRAGTAQIHHMLTKILKRDSSEAELKKLEALCQMVKATSLCGLGQTAPNPTLSTLRYFDHEYRALINS